MLWKKKLNEVPSFPKGLLLAPGRLFYSPLLIHIFNVFICIFILWYLYGFVIHYGWWTGDDTAILYSTVENGALKHFYSPQIWRSLSCTNLTPWINLSFGIDWHLFGFHVKGFYIHQLISFSITLIFCYLAIVEFLPPFVTLITLILFITSRPAACFVEFLWVRHYLEGLGLAAMAFWLFIKSATREKMWVSVLGAIFFGLAMSAKEIYAPLVVILFFFPLEISNFASQKQLWHRFKLLIPYIIIATVYIIWRIYMLGFSNVIAGDYPTETKHFSLGSILEKFIFGFIHSMGWSQTEAAIIAILVISGGILYVRTDLKKLFFLLLWAALITIPVLPVLVFLEGNPVPVSSLRILIAWVISLYILLGVSLKKLLSMQRELWLAGILCFFLIGINVYILAASNYQQQAIDTYIAHKATGNFVLSPRANALLVNPPAASWFYLFLKKLGMITHQIPKGSSTPRICADICLCSQIMRGRGVSWWQYNNGRVVPIEKLEICAIQDNKPLRVKMVYKNGIARWELGPYRKGKYFFLGAEGDLPVQTLNIPSRGSCHVLLRNSFDFWIRYDSPAGWRTYSPLLHLTPVNGVVVFVK